MFCFLAAPNLAPLTKTYHTIKLSGLRNVLFRNTKLYVIVHTNFWKQFTIFITTLVREPKQTEQLLPQEFFFLPQKQSWPLHDIWWIPQHQHLNHVREVVKILSTLYFVIKLHKYTRTKHSYCKAWKKLKHMIRINHRHAYPHVCTNRDRIYLGCHI